jgi:excisionase family DNA binding protein
MTDKTFYTVDQAAKLLGLHTETVRRMIRRGEIAFVKTGSRYRISSDAIAETKNDLIEAPPRHDPSPLAIFATREWREGRHPRQIERAEQRVVPPTFIIVNGNQIAQRREGTSTYDVLVTVHGPRPKATVEQLLAHLKKGWDT